MTTNSYPSDPFEAFCYASAYLSGVAAIHQLEFSEKAKPLGEHAISEALHIPATVLQILCLEVFLKCLILVRGNSPQRTHNIKTLFNSLSAEDQQSVRDGFRRPRLQIGPNVVGIDSVLDRTEDTFERLRYGYEHPTPRAPKDGITQGNLGFGEAIQAVRSVILAEHADWHQKYQNRVDLL